MKLRIRSLESKETTRIEVPISCSLQQLRDAVARSVSSSSSSSSPSSPASVRLSLNRKDELVGSSPGDSLQSLGITSGDLIFFTLNPNAFSPETLVVQPSNLQKNMAVDGGSNPVGSSVENQALRSRELPMEPQTSDETLTLELNGTSNPKGASLEIPIHQTIEESKLMETQNGEQNQTIEPNQTLGISGSGNMDIDDESMVESGKSFSVPSFLRKVFAKEVGEGGGGDHKLLVIAVHAVLIESGFVGFNPVSKMKVEGFHLPDQWPSSAFTVSLFYTLPEIVDNVPSASPNGFQPVTLKFQSLGKYVNVYGSLPNHGSGPYHVRLNEDRLAFFLNLLWANCDSVDEMKGEDNVSIVCPEREVFEFWKTVKDGLALPLLIDLCEKAGLAPPPCFMRLPTDLKLKIFESLPGNDVAKVGCVCSELRYLSSNEDLWKQKFAEQFGDAVGSSGGSAWKPKFASETRKRKRKPFSRREEPRRFLRGGLFVPRIIRDPVIFGAPRIIGGDHDILPFPLGGAVRGARGRNVLGGYGGYP